MTERVGRVAGHELHREGRAFGPGGQILWSPAREGHGLCVCGELSPLLYSDAARKRWHREHKANVLRARMEVHGR